ncbi:MAG: hypothetical protein V2J89_08960, partial [Halieaceae bacterium]|nr:hypothetical protein [Halieaceae bacterium]
NLPMISNVKLYAQLDQMEEELCARLVAQLRDAAAGLNEGVFCVGDFMPDAAPRPGADAETEQLVLLGRQILSLRSKLGEPTAGTPAERICWYCRRWAERYGRPGNSARDLARAFLKEIGSPL